MSKIEEFEAEHEARSKGEEAGFRTGFSAPNPYPPESNPSRAFQDGMRAGWHTRYIGAFVRGDLKEVPTFSPGVNASKSAIMIEALAAEGLPYKDVPLASEEKFVNLYECPCGTTWEDESTGVQNDRCPKCNTECQPSTSSDA